MSRRYCFLIYYRVWEIKVKSLKKYQNCEIKIQLRLRIFTLWLIWMGISIHFFVSRDFRDCITRHINEISTKHHYLNTLFWKVIFCMFSLQLFFQLFQLEVSHTILSIHQQPHQKLSIHLVRELLRGYILI